MGCSATLSFPPVVGGTREGATTAGRGAKPGGTSGYDCSLFAGLLTWVLTGYHAKQSEILNDLVCGIHTL